MSSDEAEAGRQSPGDADRPDNVVGETLEKAGHLAGDIGRLGLAWIELARAEMAVARASAMRLLLASIAVLVLALLAWVFAWIALGTLLHSIGWPMSAAFAGVAAVNILIIGLLAMFMKRWRRAMQMPDSRAALADIARTLSS